MADPISLTALAITAGSAAYSATQMNKGGGETASSPAAPAALPPDPSTPASAPGSKPGKKNQQQSFLSGAAGLQRDVGSTTGTGGKSLLGQ